MRIIHLASYSLYSGPIPSTLGLAIAQRELGHEVWLAHDTKRGAINDFEEAADSWIAQNDLGMPNPLTLSTKSSPTEFLADLLRLRTFVHDHEIDIAHVHLSHDHVLSTIALPRRWDVKLVRTIHSDRSLEDRMGQRFLNRRADGWVVRCNEHELALQEQLWGDNAATEEKRHFVRSIWGGIDGNCFEFASLDQRAQARERFGIPPDALVLGHVALMAGRGQEELVDALTIINGTEGAKLPHILFVGRGEHEDALREHVKASPVADHIHFSGYLQGDDLHVGYAAMDAAFCAQPGNDASARAVLEAMSSGLPIVAVQVGSLVETVSEKYGYPVPVRTPSAIADGIKNWCSDLDTALERGERARDYVVENRSFAVEAEKTLELYESCLKGD